MYEMIRRDRAINAEREALKLRLALVVGGVKWEKTEEAWHGLLRMFQSIESHETVTLEYAMAFAQSKSGERRRKTSDEEMVEGFDTL